jgi:hypothetical protein
MASDKNGGFMKGCNLENWLYMRTLAAEALSWLKHDERMSKREEAERLRKRAEADGRVISKVIDGKEYIGIEEFCRLFYCDYNAACKWRREGMPCQKVGRIHYYNIEDCQAWFRGEK